MVGLLALLGSRAVLLPLMLPGLLVQLVPLASLVRQELLALPMLLARTGTP